MKKKLKPVIVVEGKSDVNKLSLLVDADFVITNGSEVSRETIDYLTSLSSFRQIIILTDPDYPGMKIRNIINQAIPHCYNAFIRKEKAIKHHKVGVAECDDQEILNALDNLLLYKEIDVNDREIEEKDLFLLGLSGKDNSSKKRDYLSSYYHLGKVNAKTLLKRLNMIGVTLIELKEVMDKYEDCK